MRWRLGYILTEWRNLAIMVSKPRMRYRADSKTRTQVPGPEGGHTGLRLYDREEDQDQMSNVLTPAKTPEHVPEGRHPELEYILYSRHRVQRFFDTVKGFHIVRFLSDIYFD